MKKQKMQMLITISIILISCFPVLVNKGESYTIFQLFVGNIKTVDPVIPIQVPAVLLFLTPMQYLIYMILLKINHADRYERVIVYLSLLTTVIGIFSLLLCGLGVDSAFTVWPWIRMPLIFIAHWLPKMYDSFQDFQQNDKQRKIEEQQEREVEHAKRMEDTNQMKHIRKNPYLKKILWKIYKSNIRSSILLLTSAIISSAFLFTTIAVYIIFSDLQKGQVPVVGDELSILLWDAIILIGILSIFILAFSLKMYVKSRVKDYNLMIILGISNKVLNYFIAIEYIGTLVIGLLIGISMGSVMTVGFETVLHSIYPAFISIELPSIKTYFIVCFSVILLFLVSTIVNYEIYIEMQWGSLEQISISKEKIPGRWLRIKCVVGIIFMLFSSYLFSKPVWTESIYLIIMFLVGCYIFISAGGAWILKNYRKKDNAYYKRLLFLQQFYSRFKTQTRNFGMIYILHFLLIAYFSVRISAIIPLNRGEVLFPYDYVCIGEKEDEKTFQEFQKKFSQKSIILPMLRITVVSASEANSGNRMDINFQGQNIGISENSYNKLTGKELGLTNKEIYISFQQDKSEKAHLLDFSVLTGSPRMRIGMPEPYFFADRNKIFNSDYKVIGQERRIIIGNLAGGMQENIVVFSDEYFKSVYSTGNGPSTLALFNITKDKEKEAAIQFSDYAKDHMKYSKYDSIIQPVYEKKVLQNNTLLSHMLKFLEYIFVIILLLISILYVFIVKMVSELLDTRARMKKLKYLGMNKRLYKKILNFENNVMIIIPLVLAIVAGIIYIFITFKVRCFTKIEQQEFWKYEIWIVGVYVFINLIVAFIMGRIMIWLGDKEE
ncbi:ABC transporter permease [Clostridium sp. Marseille-Q2269]|uniref:ABC transporter permease n=1 Tax=Clostridium sp. Marseille-Q2269 TaxID=2942205 RepID=UPI002074633A|nr:ABC transporter permease [Clostridium sp. Marseille-Q2269]